MALTTKDISLIKEALQPEFMKVKVEVINEVVNIVINQISGIKVEMNALEKRLGKRIDMLEVNIENRIQLSERNIIEMQGELHQDHEVRIR